MKGLIWNAGDRNMTSLREILFDISDVNTAIRKLEAAAGVEGDWEQDEYGFNWWGLHGTFDGVVFTVYTHKSGTLKIGGHDGLDVAGVKAALLEVIR